MSCSAYEFNSKGLGPCTDKLYCKMATRLSLDEVGLLFDGESLDSESGESGGEEVYGYLGDAEVTAADFAAVRKAVGSGSTSSDDSSAPGGLFSPNAAFTPGTDLSPSGGEMELEDPGEKTENKQLHHQK